jgi:hypothetical protein
MSCSRRLVLLEQFQGALRCGGEPLIGGAEPSGVLSCSRHGSLRPSCSPPPLAGRAVNADRAVKRVKHLEISTVSAGEACAW